MTDVQPSPEQAQPEITIRPATEADVPKIEAFITRFVATGDVLPRTMGELEHLLPTFYVAEMEGEIVGCATLEIYSWKLAEVRSVCVSPTVQGRGVGKRLVQQCVDLAKERNIREVMAITRSEEFFRACGFGYTLPHLKKALFLPTGEDVVGTTGEDITDE